MTPTPNGDSDSVVHDRIRQQEVVAELGQQALETDDLDQLMHDAAAAVAKTLDNEYAKVLELLPDGDEVFLRQGIGWRDGLVGNATVPTDMDSQAGYTLLSEQPIIVDELRSEERFSGPELLTSHDVVSGISVIIGSVENPWGVLGTHTTERREFTEHDANFVQSVANVLASAIENEKTRHELEKMHRRISDAFYSLNENWEFTYLNGRAEELIDFTEEGLVGKHVWETFEWGADSKLKTEYERAMETQEATSFELYYPEPLERRYEINAYPSETGLSVYFRDVTEQRKREQNLRETQRQLEMATKAASIGLWTWDIQENIVTPDKSLVELYDMESDETMEGAPMEAFYESIHEDDEEQTWDRLERAVEETGELEAEYRVCDADGNIMWVTARGKVVYNENGEPIQMNGAVADITERKKRERQLEESERRYRTLAENFPNGAVGVYDDELRYTLIEGAALGGEMPNSEYLKDETLHEIFPPETLNDIEPVFRAAIEDGETNNTTTEFGSRDWRVWAAPLRDSNGEIFAGLSFAQDVTEQLERERQLEESNERLEQFAYAASHDLQEPLRMVTSYLQLLEKRYGDDLDEDGEEFLEFAVDGAERMREMIDGLLEYSRVDTQGDPFESVDLDEILEDTRSNLQMKIEENDAEITAEQLPQVQADANQVQQVFQNLISNAIKYSGDEPPQIHVEAERNGRMHLISVHDEGVGIDPDDQDQVFEVFQRPHSREEHSGTGIGLALCQRIIERHGGRIWVDSEPNEGQRSRLRFQKVERSGRRLEIVRPECEHLHPDASRFR